VGNCSLTNPSWKSSITAAGTQLAMVRMSGLALPQDGSLPNYQDETPAADGEQCLRDRTSFYPSTRETREIPRLSLGFQLNLHLGAVLPSLHRFFWSHCSMPKDHAHPLHNTKTGTKNSILATTNFRPEDLPNWFKMALFNELYDPTGGGTGVQLISADLWQFAVLVH